MCPFLRRFCPESSSFPKQPTEDPHDMEGISVLSWRLAEGLRGPSERARCSLSSQRLALTAALVIHRHSRREKTRALIKGDLKGRAANSFVSSWIPGFTLSLTHDGETARLPSYVPPQSALAVVFLVTLDYVRFDKSTLVRNTCDLVSRSRFMLLNVEEGHYWPNHPFSV